MQPRFPYLGVYYQSQGYSDNAFNYPNGKHGGLDIVPLLTQGGNHWLAPIYPILSGTTLSVSNTDVDRGKGIKVRTTLDSGFITYLKVKGLIPNNHSGNVHLEHLYWHCHQVTDLDGQITQDTPVGLTGNTGNVWAGGQPVPSNQKGVPNYPGLHLHFECVLKSDNQTFNLDRDYLGRIDPQIILEYRDMNNYFAHKSGTPEYGFVETTPYTTVYHRAISESDIKFQATKFGVNILNADGSINFASAKEVTF